MQAAYACTFLRALTLRCTPSAEDSGRHVTQQLECLPTQVLTRFSG